MLEMNQIKFLVEFLPQSTSVQLSLSQLLESQSFSIMPDAEIPRDLALNEHLQQWNTLNLHLHALQEWQLMLL
jgi:hypothetical protein